MLQLPAGPQNLRDFRFSNGANDVTLRITDDVSRVEGVGWDYGARLGYRYSDLIRTGGGTLAHKDADGPFPKNGFQQWRRAIAYEGSQQVGLMRRLFEQRPWYKMVPDQSVIASDQGEGTKRLVAARAEDGSFLIAYTPVGQSVSIHMNKLNGSK